MEETMRMDEGEFGEHCAPAWFGIVFHHLFLLDHWED
jgi:hypothetical protein